MRKRNEGLKKRCACPRRQWAKCSHPWHFGFHHAGKEHRVSLNKVANKPAGYHMSKSEAESLRDTLRAQIREGSFLDPSADAAITLKDERITFGDVVDRYIERFVRVPSRRPGALEMFQCQLNVLRRTEVSGPAGIRVQLENVPMDSITTDDVESIRVGRRAEAESRRADGKAHGLVRGGEVGTNRLLARLRHVFNWAIAKGLVDRTPFKRHGVTMISLAPEQSRDRRLEPGEEEKLRQFAGAHLYAMIAAALETGCRQGELLALQWKHVHLDRNLVMVEAEMTKTNRERVIPISQTLGAVLEMRRHAPDGQEHPPTAFVFGNEVGERIKSIKTAWRLTCARAGIRGLHFHDLRREFGSRLLETPGVAGHEVRDWLGHANITTTNRYLSTAGVGLQRTLEKFEKARKVRTTFAQSQNSEVELSGSAKAVN